MDSFHHEGEKPFQPGLRQVPTRRQIASAHTTTRAAPSGGPKPTIVLEHGAWADSGSWDAVIQRLQADGYTVYAPPNPLQGLTYDSAFLADFLHSISGPIVLVGHSYGGGGQLPALAGPAADGGRPGRTAGHR